MSRTTRSRYHTYPEFLLLKTSRNSGISQGDSVRTFRAVVLVTAKGSVSRGMLQSIFIDCLSSIMVKVDSNSMLSH